MKRRQFVTSVLAGGLAAPVLAAGQHDHGDTVDGPLANIDVSFGQWHTSPPLDRFPNLNPITGNVHKLIPFEAKIKAGGTVNFIISGFHLVTVYGPGTDFDDISTAVLTPIPGAPMGFPPIVDDPVNRVYRGLSPFGLPQDRVEAVNFANPGRYLAVCTFLPHFLDKMFGHITVLP
jgi:plastocyanin